MVTSEVLDTRGQSRMAGRCFALLSAIALAGLLNACKTPPRDPATVDLGPVPQWSDIAAAQRTRLQRLLPMRAGGAVELRWEENGSRRFENCRGELYLRTPLESALDLRKVGERFLLVGSDDDRQWVFDLSSSDGEAWVRARGDRWTAGGPPIPAEVDLSEVFGLMDLPVAPMVPPRWAPNSTSLSERAIEVVIGPVGMPRRLLLEPTTFHPTRVELLDPAVGAIVVSELSEYLPVEREGLPPGARPRFPTRVRLRTSDGTAEIALFLQTPETPPRIPERLLMLDALMETFRPAIVHGVQGDERRRDGASIEDSSPE